MKDNKFSIGKPCSDPPSVDGRRDRWEMVWRALEAAPEGEWIPVTCTDAEAAVKLQTSCGTYTRFYLRDNGKRCKTRRVGNVLWMSIVKNGEKP